jgi:hypothetical protein
MCARRRGKILERPSMPAPPADIVILILGSSRPSFDAPGRQARRSAYKKELARAVNRATTMEHPTTWSRAAANSSELPGLLLLMSASVVLIGVWCQLWFTRVPLAPEQDWKEWYPVALEELHAACQAGNGAACNDLGVSYERGYGTAPRWGKALEQFERACRAGSPDGCNNQGAMLERGGNGARDLERARELYQHACEKGSALGCSNLGALYAKGKGVPRDEADARWLFERACQKGCATGCNNLIALYEPRPRGNSI